jgi:transcriptional regulator GlxA family with amidase domain
MTIAVHETLGGRELSDRVARLLSHARSSISLDPAAADNFLAQATSLLEGEFAQPAPAAIGGLAPWQIRRVKAAVEANLDRKLNTSELAAAAGLSTSHFCRAFKKSLGSSPQAYVLRRRVERTKHLMLSTHEPLCEISLACGFFDQAHLSRAFRRSQGCAPAAWRRERRMLS